jgi:Kef-type K+ transport system membrane component KefB
MPLLFLSVGLSKKFVEIFQKTPLGVFLAQFPVAQQQKLLQSYLKDFLLLTMKVSSREELMVGMESGLREELT